MRGLAHGGVLHCPKVSQFKDFFDYFRVLKWEPTIPSLPSSRGDPIGIRRWGISAPSAL